MTKEPLSFDVRHPSPLHQHFLSFRQCFLTNYSHILLEPFWKSYNPKITITLGWWLISILLGYQKRMKQVPFNLQATNPLPSANPNCTILCLLYTVYPTRLSFPIQFHVIPDSILCTGLISRVDYTVAVLLYYPSICWLEVLSKHKTRDSYGASCSKKNVNIPTKPGQNSSTTHQGTNISPSKVAGKLMSIFHRHSIGVICNMLVPRRVSYQYRLKRFNQLDFGSTKINRPTSYVWPPCVERTTRK